MDIEGLILAQLKSAAPTDRLGVRQTSALTPGQILLAKVAAEVEPGRVLLEILGRTLTAPNRLGLKAGQEIQVRVESVPTGETGEVVLRLLDQGGQAGQIQPLVRLLTAAQADARPLAPVIKELIAALADLPAAPKSPLESETRLAMAALKRSLIKPDPVDPAATADKLKELPARLGLDLEPALARLAKAAGPLKVEAIKNLTQALRAQLSPSREEAGSREAVEVRSPAGPQTKSGRAARIEMLAQGLKPRLMALAGRLEEAAAEPKRLAEDFPPLRRALRRWLGLLAPAGRDRAARLTPESLAQVKRIVLKDVARIVERAWRAVGTEEAGAEKEETVRRARRVVENFWPRLIATIKTRPAQTPQAVEEMKEALERFLVRMGLSPQRQASSLLAKVHEAVRGLEATQVINAAAAETDSALLVPLPLALPQEIAAGQLYLFQPGRGRRGRDRGDGPLRLVFLLDMSRLGPIRVDLGLDRRAKEIMANIYLARKEAVSFTRQWTDRLHRALKSLGYTVTSLGVRRLAQAPAVDSLAPEPEPLDGESLIDLKA